MAKKKRCVQVNRIKRKIILLDTQCTIMPTNDMMVRFNLDHQKVIYMHKCFKLYLYDVKHGK